MKAFKNFILIVLLQSMALASDDGFLSQISKRMGFSGTNETSETISFPGQIKLNIKQVGSSYELTSSIGDQESTAFLSLSKIESMTLFSTQNSGLNNIRKIAIKDQNSEELYPASTWFAIEAKDIYLVLKQEKAFKVYKLPFPEGSSLGDISVSPVRLKDGYSFIVSYRDKNNIGRTYLLNPKKSTVSIIQEKFHKLSILENNFPKGNYKYSESSETLQLPHELEVDLNQSLAKSYSVEEVTHSITRSQDKPAQQAEVSATPTANKTVTSTTNQAPKTENSAGLNPGFQKEFEYNNDHYKIYSINKPTKGTYITRKSDGTTVMISSQLIPNTGSDFGGFHFEEGILSHQQLMRSIDLGLPGATEDIFKIESTFHPESESKDAVTWVLDNFQDYKIQAEKDMAPISKRSQVINEITEVLFSGETTSQILVGEGSDKDLMLSSVVKSIPRTWKAIEFDPGSIGDISMSGYLEEKTKKISDAIKSIPIVLIAKDFPNFAGFGVTQGSTRDILQLLRKDFTSPHGHLKLIGTSYNTDQIVEKIKDPSISNNLQMVPVDKLSPSEIKEHLRKFFSTSYPTNEKINLSDSFLDYLINKANQIKRVDPEPKRSENFLTSIVRKLRKTKTFSSENFTLSEIDRAVTYHFKIAPELATEEGQNELLHQLKPKIGEKIVGHGHIIQDIFMGTGIGLSGLHSDRGPMQTHWLEGPPGVGKTELAKTMAEAIKVPFVYIEMNQFKRGNGNTSAQLLSQIAMALKKNPYSLILLDEVEKADPKVLEGLLAVLSNDVFTYYEDGKAKPESAVNATFVFTSNGIGELVLEWYYSKISQDEKYNNLTSEELNREFLSLFSKEDLIERLVTSGNNSQLDEPLPRPLLDRMKYFHVAFPPGYDATVALLKIKLREIKKRAETSMEIKFKLGGKSVTEEDIMKLYVKKARSEKKSVRSTIDEFEKAVKGTLFLMKYENPKYKDNKYYLVNPLQSESSPINKCLVKYLF